MIERLLNHYSDKIPFDQTGTLEKRELMLGLEIVIATAINVLSFIMLFGLMGYLKHGVLFLMIFCWFRGYTGGIHMKTQFRCFGLMVTFGIASIAAVEGLSICNWQWVSSFIVIGTIFLAIKYEYSRGCIISLLILLGLSLSGNEIGVIGATSLLFAWITKLWEVKQNERNVFESTY